MLLHADIYMLVKCIILFSKTRQRAERKEWLRVLRKKEALKQEDTQWRTIEY